MKRILSLSILAAFLLSLGATLAFQVSAEGEECMVWIATSGKGKKYHYRLPYPEEGQTFAAPLRGEGDGLRAVRGVQTGRRRRLVSARRRGWGKE